MKKPCDSRPPSHLFSYPVLFVTEDDAPVPSVFSPVVKAAGGRLLSNRALASADLPRLWMPRVDISFGKSTVTARSKAGSFEFPGTGRGLAAGVERAAAFARCFAVRELYGEMLGFTSVDTRFELSVIICTLDRHQPLLDCLAALDMQNLTKDRYEVIVVDNSGTIDLASFLRERGFTVPVLLCPLPGLSCARNAGISRAGGAYILFIDDDVLVREDSLERILDAMNRPCAPAVAGGAADLKVPASVPGWLNEDYWCFWGHFQPRCDKFTFVDDWKSFPWGCNWCARRDALLRVGGFDPSFGRVGHNHAGGEEIDVAARIHGLGGGVAIEPRARVVHAVDAARFDITHLRKVIEAASRTYVALFRNGCLGGDELILEALRLPLSVLYNFSRFCLGLLPFLRVRQSFWSCAAFFRALFSGRTLVSVLMSFVEPIISGEPGPTPIVAHRDAAIRSGDGRGTETLRSAVSVILPVSGGERGLAESVGSALSQPETAEVLIVCRGEAEAACAAGFGLSDKYGEKVRVLRGERGLKEGVPYLQRLGITCARAPYIAFLHAGDKYLPRRFSYAVSLLDSNRFIDGVCDLVQLEEPGAGRPALVAEDIHPCGLTLRKEILDFTGLFDMEEADYRIEVGLKAAAFACFAGTGRREPVASCRQDEENFLSSATAAETPVRFNSALGAYEWACRLGLEFRTRRMYLCILARRLLEHGRIPLFRRLLYIGRYLLLCPRLAIHILSEFGRLFVRRRACC